MTTQEPRRRCKEVRIAKGVRIRGEVLQASLPSLAGMQMKVGLNAFGVTGVVRHIRSDIDVPHPGVDHIGLLVDPDEGYKGPMTNTLCDCGPHVVVRLRRLIDVLGEPIPVEQATLVIDIPDPEEG